MVKTGKYHSDVAWHTNQSLGLMLITLTKGSKTLEAGKGHRNKKLNNNAVHRQPIHERYAACCTQFGKHRSCEE